MQLDLLNKYINLVISIHLPISILNLTINFYLDPRREQSWETRHKTSAFCWGEEKFEVYVSSLMEDLDKKYQEELETGVIHLKGKTVYRIL